MSVSRSKWWKWCRLCAKIESEDIIHIELDSIKDGRKNLHEALEKHFNINSSSEDKIKYFCEECCSFLSFLSLFNKHVEKVQEMYKFLVDNSADESCNLQAMRMKFNVVSSIIGNWPPRVEESISGTTSKESANIISDEITIKSEYSDLEQISESGCKEEQLYDLEEISTSECKEEPLYDLEEISASKCKEEPLYDADSPADSQYDDQLILMPDDSVWSDDEEFEESRNKGNDRILVNSNQPSDISVEENSGSKNSKRKLRGGYCRKKKPMVEDFVLDVACKVCEQKFDLYSAYCEHMELMHEIEKSEKFCPFCNRNLQTWYHLGRHMRTHMPVESRFPIKCPECDSRYTSSTQLEVHLNHKHRNEKPYICEVCGFCGATRHSLTQHMYVHTDNAPYECEICKKGFKKRSRLNVHMDIHGPNKFVCTICGMQLNTRATLKKHFLVHSDKRRYKCDHCGAAFKQTQAFKEHLIFHLDLRPHSCHFCDRTFNTRSTCRTHMTKIHAEDFASMEKAGYKAYTTNIPTLAYLREAVKSGNNLRPVSKYATNPPLYKCKFCERRFSYIAQYKAHMKQKHPTEYGSIGPVVDLRSENRINRLKARKSIDTKTKKVSEYVTCVICGRTFKNKMLYEIHMKKKHANEKVVLHTSSYGPESETSSQVQVINEASNLEDPILSMESHTLSLNLNTGSTSSSPSIHHDLFLIVE